MKLIKNERGATLEAAVIVTLVLLILGGGILSIAYNYYKRSFDQAYYREAYLNASSIAQSIGREIASTNKESEYSKYIPSSAGGTVTLSDFVFHDTQDQDLNSSGTITLSDDEKTLTIKITTKVHNATASATQTLQKYDTSDTIWQLGKLR